MRHRLILCALWALAGCETPGAGPPAPGPVCTDPDGDGFGVGCVAGTDCAEGNPAVTNECRRCLAADTGCACEPGAEPVDCYVGPTGAGGATVCHEGQRFCVDGQWSVCRNIQSYVTDEPGGARAALIDGPSECNPCDPACAIARDYPSSGDLTPENSANVVTYSPSLGGIILAEDPDGGGIIGTWRTDSDRDGVPDVADDFPLDPTLGHINEGIYYALPFGGPSIGRRVDVTLQIVQGDVYFLTSTRASMSQELAAFKAAFNATMVHAGCDPGITGAIACVLPDVRFAAGSLEDYAIGAYGNAAAGDLAFRHSFDFTTDRVAANAAIGAMVVRNGGDAVDAQAQALYAMTTGFGLTTLVPGHAACAAGSYGYGCFRDRVLPIAVIFTDTPFHNGPTAANDYDTTMFATLPAPPMASTAVAGNDLIAAAYNVGDLSIVNAVKYTGDTTGMANDLTPTCAGSTSPDAVYRFTLSSPRNVRITTAGSAWDTMIAVFNSAFVQVGCNDDADATLQSRVDLTLPAGTYYVSMDGWATNSGPYTLTFLSSAGALPSWADTVAALQARGVKTLVVESSGMAGASRTDSTALCNATGSTNRLGAVQMRTITAAGVGLAGAVDTLIRDLMTNSLWDISLVPRDNPTTPTFDERTFIKDISIARLPRECDHAAGPVAVDCEMGAAVVFQMEWQNDVLPGGATPQVLTFTLDTVVDGRYVIHTEPVRIIVPPDGSATVYEPVGMYTRTYDATTYCMATERPYWNTFSFTATTDPDSWIRFEFTTADTSAELATAPVAFYVDVPTGTSPQDLRMLLDAAGFPVNLFFLKVTAWLHASTGLTVSPVLMGFETTFDCLPAE